VEGGRGLFKVTSLNLEVVDTSGNWVVVSPMFFNTTDSTNTVYAKINATNIGNGTIEEPLGYLQYYKFDFEVLENSIPDFGEYGELRHYLWIELGNTLVNMSWIWIIFEDVATVYSADMDVYVNDTHLIDKYHTSKDHTDSLELHFWRSKSNQLIIQYVPGTGNALRFTYGDIISNWDVWNFTYSCETITDREMSFTLVYNDLSYQCGSNEGISDPVSNESWGIFEPIRQILLFILNLFIGLIDLILPEKIENVFHHFLDRLDDYINPFLDIFLWLGSNWLEILLLIHVFLIIRGVERASKGDILGLILPLFEFYTMIFNMVMRIVGFIVNIIKAMIEAIPFI